jgi:RNA polymerase sigma-70 factor (ECF subfamily)
LLKLKSFLDVCTIMSSSEYPSIPAAGNSPEMEKRKLLVGLLTRHQRQILRYIHTLVPHMHDAEDILQETSTVICEKFDTFREGSDFMAWACEIAWWRVRAARTGFARSKICFNDEVLSLVAETAAGMHEEMDRRGEALENCMRKLASKDRELIEARFQHGRSIEEAASHNGRSLEAAYKALARIRRALYECVSRQAAEALT